ncbi:MAG: hypothetical protein FJX67_02805 [Alphaproteobacteria bacterium]|nr:hypothetical protein [Alphaproteobacteria bacterium]
MSPLATTLLAEITARPQQFDEIVDAHRAVPWRTFLYAWGELRAADLLTRDDDGNFVAVRK